MELIPAIELLRDIIEKKYPQKVFQIQALDNVITVLTPEVDQEFSDFINNVHKSFPEETFTFGAYEFEFSDAS